MSYLGHLIVPWCSCDNSWWPWPVPSAVCGVWSLSSDGVMVILITNITNPRSGWYLALIAHWHENKAIPTKRKDQKFHKVSLYIYFQDHKSSGNNPDGCSGKFLWALLWLQLLKLTYIKAIWSGKNFLKLCCIIIKLFVIIVAKLWRVIQGQDWINRVKTQPEDSFYVSLISTTDHLQN